jgi:hypothetical protein
MIVCLNAPLSNEDIIQLLFRIQSATPLPVVDGLFNIEGTTQKGTVLEGIGITGLVLIEQLKEILPTLCLKPQPGTDGLIDKVPVRMCGFQLIDEGRLSSTNVALDSDQDGLRSGHF